MKLKFYETHNPYTGIRRWWTQRDVDGKDAEIRTNHKGTLDLFICDTYKTTHETLQDAMNESEKYVGEHIVNR